MSIPTHPITERAIRAEFIKNWNEGEENPVIQLLDKEDQLYCTWSNIVRYFENYLGCYYIENIEPWIVEQWRWNLHQLEQGAYEKHWTCYDTIDGKRIVARMCFKDNERHTVLVFNAA